MSREGMCQFPLELQVTGSVPALAWPPAPVTCLSSTASENPVGSMKAAGRQLQGKEPAPNVHPL